ncbi:MAG TPA: ABC transporter permease [bacterium]|nr:ABC transporter permease [bacterium]
MAAIQQVKGLDRFGRGVLGFLEEAGRVVLLFSSTLRWVLRGVLEWRQTVLQMARIGVESLPIILVTGTFAGMVLAFQTSKQLIALGAPGFIGGAVAVSMAREAAPVFTAITVAGRISAGIAAELGTMAVTEQIDALRVMATNPVRFLVVPRVLAGVTMQPLLTIFANVAGLVGGGVIAALAGVQLETYGGSVQRFLRLYDFMCGLLKAAAFGIIITMIGSYRGLATSGGAEGVGRAATAAVVVSIVLILVTNYFLDVVLF